MKHGTYVLILTLTTEQELTIGKLGTYTFQPGTYAYVGSAFGPGGFKRIQRHENVSNGDNNTRHWHIDYLLPHATITDTIKYPNKDIECDLAQTLPGTPIPQFGATDCNCTTHLYHATETQIKETLPD